MSITESSSQEPKKNVSGPCILFTIARGLAADGLEATDIERSVHTSKNHFQSGADDIFPSSSYIIIRLRRKASMSSVSYSPR